MIPFFRKIRYKLAKDNQFLKYSRYAIGEILLVVVGILIALQINNWNEEYKARLQEITILENIKEDISLDTLDISFNIDHHERFIRAEKQLLIFLQSTDEHPKGNIKYSNALGVPLTIVLHKSTFTNLQNNEIGILTNNRLKKDISRFYDFYVQHMVLLENEKSTYEFYDSKKAFFQKYFKLSNETFASTDRQSNNEDFYNPELVKTDLVLDDIDGAKNDEAFKIELNESIFVRQFKIDFYINLMKNIEELNAAIDQELKLLRD